MHIEDIITTLAFSPIKVNPYDSSMVYSFADQIGRGNGFTEKQSTIAIKIATKYITSISKFLSKDLSNSVSHPSFKLPIRKLTHTKKLSIIDHPEFKKAIKAEFPYNEALINSIRLNRSNLGHAAWDKDEKAWIFALSEQHIQFLSNITANENFEIDEELVLLRNNVADITQHIEDYVPMLTFDNNQIKLKNVSKYVPELTSTEILPAVFEARKRGVFTWDDTISSYIENDVEHYTSEFLKTDPSKATHINSEKVNISVLKDIILNLSPCIIVVPSGLELEKTNQVYEFLTGIGITAEEMTVLFRLSTETDKKFNDFVKDRSLNSPISDKTKIVFISSKLPKPLLKAKIKFHSAINLGITPVHYTMRDYMKYQENLVFFSESVNHKVIANVFM